ncbi:MAG: hypothetical protein K1W04_07620 [Oscillospiraceae bacterium]
MDEKTAFERKQEEISQPEPLYVDGCKVTVHYSQDKNPDAIRGIRNILLSGTKSGKD